MQIPCQDNWAQRGNLICIIRYILAVYYPTPRTRSDHSSPRSFRRRFLCARSGNRSESNMESSAPDSLMQAKLPTSESSLRGGIAKTLGAFGHGALGGNGSSQTTDTPKPLGPATPCVRKPRPRDRVTTPAVAPPTYHLTRPLYCVHPTAL
jgi:hypothetical protein